MSSMQRSNAATQRSALGAILNGDPSGYQALYSDAEDVTLGNPFGPYAHARSKVAATLAGAAAHYCEGEVTGIDLIESYVADDLACIVEVEHGRAKVGGGEKLFALALRATSVFRLEHGSCKLVHRHADPITTTRPATSVVST